MARSRAERLPQNSEVVLSDYELRESLEAIGLINPVWYFEKRCIDGRRRLEMCSALKLEPRALNITDRTEAARMLYRIHPRRAFEMFAPKRASYQQLKWLFGGRYHQIPRVVPFARPATQRASATTAVLGGIAMPRGVYELAIRNCHAQGTTLSAMVRHYMHQLAGVDCEHPLAKAEPLNRAAE